MKCSKNLVKRIAMTLTVLMCASSLGVLASADTTGSDNAGVFGDDGSSAVDSLTLSDDVDTAINQLNAAFGDYADFSVKDSPYIAGGKILVVKFKNGTSLTNAEQESLVEDTLKPAWEAKSYGAGYSISYAATNVDTSNDTAEDTELKAYGKQKMLDLFTQFPMLQSMMGSSIDDASLDYIVNEFYNQLTENRTKTITTADIDTYVDAISSQMSAMLGDTSAGGLTGLATGLLGDVGDLTDDDDIADLTDSDSDSADSGADETELTDAQIEAICNSVRRALKGLDVNTTTPSYVDFTANPILVDMALDDYLERVAAGEYGMSDTSANDYVMAVAENIEALNNIMSKYQGIADWWLDDSGNIELYFDIMLTTDEQNTIYAEIGSKMASLPLKNWLIKLPSKTYTNHSTEAQRLAADRDTKFSAFSSHTDSDYLLAFVTGQTSDEDASNMANELAIDLADLAKGDKNAFGKSGYLEIEVMQPDHTSRIYSFDFDDFAAEDDVAAPDISVEPSTGGADDDEVATVVLDETGHYVTVTSEPSITTEPADIEWATIDDSDTKPDDSKKPTETATNTTPATGTATLSNEDIANMSADELEKYITSAVDAQVAAATKNNTVTTNTTEKWKDSPKTVETQATGLFWLLGILGTIGLGTFGTVYMINKRR